MKFNELKGILATVKSNFLILHLCFIFSKQCYFCLLWDYLKKMRHVFRDKE